LTRRLTMKGYNEAYCNAAIKALMAANVALMKTTVIAALQISSYGKKDTLVMDAIPEIAIARVMEAYDPDSILVTEELGRDAAKVWPAYCIPQNQPIIFFCDPTDRSAFLKKFLQSHREENGDTKIEDIIANASSRKRWGKLGDTPLSITGATSAITCLHKGVVTFSVILNYITQELFLACNSGIYRFSLLKNGERIKEGVTVADIIKQRKVIIFPPINSSHDWEAQKRYATFLGKAGYVENFDDTMIFIDKGDSFLHHREPGGPSRVLYLSNLQPAKNPVGFVLSNGEKITEWIHWLSFVRFAKQENQRALLLFELYHERPWMKDRILMSTPPHYSIFRPNEEKPGTQIIDVNQLAEFYNPSQFRSTLLVAPASNDWIGNVMTDHQYREIVFPEG